MCQTSVCVRFLQTISIGAPPDRAHRTQKSKKKDRLQNDARESSKRLSANTVPITERGAARTKRLNDSGNFGWRIELRLKEKIELRLKEKRKGIF
jgi:hypothetical protein